MTMFPIFQRSTLERLLEMGFAPFLAVHCTASIFSHPLGELASD